MKKNILIICFAIFSFYVEAQVSIGKNQINSSGLLDFAEDSSKGIILPLLESLPTNSSQGTLLVYKLDSSVYMYENSKWVCLGKNGKLPTTYINHSGVETDSTILGSRTSTATGVLILESANKSLILPKNTSPHLTIPKPRIGTLCYDKVYKAMAIFDGEKWTYWK